MKKVSIETNGNKSKQNLQRPYTSVPFPPPVYLGVKLSYF